MDNILVMQSFQPFDHLDKVFPYGFFIGQLPEFRLLLYILQQVTTIAELHDDAKTSAGVIKK
tara:strand:+ start:1056 stop:1241 length:186 start_codon:yes stop_codon:yes gene_type:complete